MSKTPEEMAEEYRENHDECEFARDAFLAGYQAAKDTYNEAISAYKDVAKQMLEEAVRIMSPKDQLADADKVMCSTTMEEIKAVDTGEITPITNLPTSAKWISVKDRLPEIEQSSFAMRKESACVLIVSNGNVHVAHLCEKWCDRTQLIFEACDCDCRGHDMEQDEWELDQVTHWMPLPAPPKEEK